MASRREEREKNEMQMFVETEKLKQRNPESSTLNNMQAVRSRILQYIYAIPLTDPLFVS